MKVTIFYESDEPTNRYGYCKVPLEKRINDFIKDKMEDLAKMIGANNERNR